jgi:hypothetical protein
VPLFSQIEASTIEAYEKGRVARTLFTATPILRVLRTNKSIYRPWQGGSYQKVPFDIQPSKAGAYDPGTDTFIVQEVQNQDAMAFDPKKYNAEVTINMAITGIYNVGARQIFDVLKEKYNNAISSLDEQIAQDIPNHGQPSGTGVANDRHKSLNGFAEMFADGLSPVWTGDTFPLYGREARNTGLTGTVLNSVPYWGGNADGSAGPISLPLLNLTYNRCKQGKGEGKILGGKPNYGFCSDYLYGQISSRVLGMQRMDSAVKSPTINLEGLKFNQAIIFADSYMPGTQNGLYVNNAAVLPNITTGTVPQSALQTASTSTNNVALSNMPLQSAATSGLTVGETFFWVRDDTLRFVFPKSGPYSFKFSGLQRAFDSDIQEDIIRAAMVLYCLIPSSNQASFGFNG